jgi:hypothetical protein
VINNTESAPDKLVKFIDDIFFLIAHKKYDELDERLKTADISNLPGDKLIGLLRTTAHVKANLKYWNSTLEKIKAEITRREFDYKYVLAGLIKEQDNG